MRGTCMSADERKRVRRAALGIQALLLLACVCLRPEPSHAWLGYSVPPIQGRVTDATTGEPIANAVLVVNWTKMVSGLVDTMTVSMKKMYVATDENGVYRIPPYWSVHIFSTFWDVNWTIRHPLYETMQRGMSRRTLDAQRHPEKIPEAELAEIRRYTTKNEAGELVSNFSLLSLDEKYKEKPSIKEFRGDLFSEFATEGPIYFYITKKTGMMVDSEPVIQIWEKIAARFKDNQNVQIGLEFGKTKILEGGLEDY